jgi:hypothetical protein
MKHLLAVFLFSGLASLFGVCPAAGVTPEALFAEKCSICHHPDRALRKTKDRQGWQETVARMQRYASGMISDTEATTVIEYLVQVRGPNN